MTDKKKPVPDSETIELTNRQADPPPEPPEEVGSGPKAGRDLP